MAEKVKVSPSTGYYGIWNTNTKTFMFGIQETSIRKVHIAVSNKIGTKQYYRKPHWKPKAIRENHAHMFRCPLKYKKGVKVSE